ncbi:MAG: GNAT family N-acetyltransferase [Proteobacteria bacterium]|nr:GNAT family N-acetyltransferase [Pseudomonadota bacterium]
MTEIDIYWAAFFGVEPKILNLPGVLVVQHKILNGYNGAWLFGHGATLIISVPESDVFATKLVAEKVLDKLRPPVPEDATSLFGMRVEQVIGPAYQGYVTTSDFRSVSHPEIRRLKDLERSKLELFATEFKPDDWEHASINGEDEHVFIATRGAEIIAAANAKEEDCATVLGVAIHPRYRGQGIGKAVVSAAVSFALTQGRPVRFQTLVANYGSIGIASALGFRDYARTVAARFIK